MLGLTGALPSSAAPQAVLRRKRLPPALLGTALALGSYSVDAALLALFHLAGVVPGALAAGYWVAGATVSCLSLLVLRTGRTLHKEDFALVAPQMTAGTIVQMVALVAAPQVGFVFLCNLFTVFAFGVLRLGVPQFLVGWMFAAAALALALSRSGSALAVPAQTPFQLGLVWLCVVTVLARCLVVAMWASGMRAKLHARARELSATLARIEQLASHDDLTGTYNRRTFLLLVEEERQRSLRTGARFCLAVADLDHFKAVNDTFGHVAGDAVLKDFAQVVGAAIRTTDKLGRYGGEEFVLLLTNAGAEAGARAAERIREAVARRPWAVGPVTVSMGVAAFDGLESVAELVARADAALYEAKAGGRNRVVSR